MDNIKYFLEYTNNENIISRLEIREKDYIGPEIEIHGNAILNYSERKDLLQALIPSSLDITLEADESITLQDLYSEQENKFSVKFYFNSQLLFVGFLKPDGIWEDWVHDKWELSVDAMDGLSILKDLSFVKDDGSFYTDELTQFETLKQCLHRIGYDLPINISVGVHYIGFSGTDSILHNVRMSTERFYQDAEKNNTMDCESVLKSILEPYNASIVQMHGEWWVFRSIDVKNVMTFKRYDLLGDYSEVLLNTTIDIGSHIDGYAIHHVNANQKKSVDPSAQAFRVHYKYGEVNNALINPLLHFNPDFTADGWTTTTAPERYIGDDGKGIGFDFVEDPAVTSSVDVGLLTLDQAISVSIGQDINISLDFTLQTDNTNGSYIEFYLETDNFIFQNGQWVAKPGTPDLYSHSQQVFDTPDNGANVSVSFGNAPETSNISLVIRAVFLFVAPDSRTSVANVFFRKIVLNQGKKILYKGEFHTAQRSTRISSVTKDDKAVSVGDSISDFYNGTLYKSNGEPTQYWYRGTRLEAKPLLRLMVEDSLNIAPRPMLYFEGDTFGYFPYLALVFINNIAGSFQISKYSYNSATNINRTAFKSFSDAILNESQIRYEFDYDYGSETKVTILE